MSHLSVCGAFDGHYESKACMFMYILYIRELVRQVLTVCVFVYHCTSFSDNDRHENWECHWKIHLLVHLPVWFYFHNCPIWKIPLLKWAWACCIRPTCEIVFEVCWILGVSPGMDDFWPQESVEVRGWRMSVGDQQTPLSGYFSTLRTVLSCKTKSFSLKSGSSRILAVILGVGYTRFHIWLGVTLDPNQSGMV